MKNLTSYDGFWPVPAAWLLPSAPIALMGVLSGLIDG
jgi:hypothetical protein